MQEAEIEAVETPIASEAGIVETGQDTTQETEPES